MEATCPHCGADLAGTTQLPQAVCDGTLCGQRLVATPPEGLPRGSPFWESIAQLATYLRYVHAISYQQLQELFADLWGLDISQGGLANLFRRVRDQLGSTV